MPHHPISLRFEAMEQRMVLSSNLGEVTLEILPNIEQDNAYEFGNDDIAQKVQKVHTDDLMQKVRSGDQEEILQKVRTGFGDDFSQKVQKVHDYDYYMQKVQKV